jgi:3-hydroxy-9,10-secoandrosta-1,3,5(10)-triene-9,17-dione monooxygenase reductase component
VYRDTTFPGEIPDPLNLFGIEDAGMAESRSLAFRRMMGRFTTGVAVVLTTGDRGPMGLTVNSLTSLSLDPPLLLFCAKNGSRTVDAVIERGVFSVNILADAQEDVSGYFAGNTDRRETAACDRHGKWLAIPDSNGALFCEVACVYPGGDHSIVVGEVKDIVAPAAARQPLLFHEGRYSRMCLPAPAIPG